MAYSPRKRAARVYARVNSWPHIAEKRLLGFAGYKAGMTHIFITDNRKNTATSGQDVFTPVTVLECPPLFPFAIRYYQESPYGFKVVGESWSENLPTNISKKLNPSKTTSFSGTATHLTMVVATAPQDAGGISSKTPEVFECAIGGETYEEKLEYAKTILGKPQKASELIQSGESVDVIAVTKGKGVQGPVKRYGIKIQRAKAQRSGKGRHVGSLGGRHTATRPTVPQAGQTGFHTRTEFSKRVLKVGVNGSEITPKGGFVNYGNVNSEYIVLKGSVPGPVKRLIRIRPSVRKHKKFQAPEISYISLESKQGK